MIRMISGTTRIGNKTYKASDVFEADKETEERLIAQGAAVACDGDVATPVLDVVGADAPANETPEYSDAESADDIPAYDENTSAKELREIGKKVGIKFPVGINKAEMRGRLDEHFFGNKPDLSAADPLI